jgi:hypothetical protein
VGDRNRIRWSDWNADDGDGTRKGESSQDGGPSRRAKVTLAFVMLGAFLVSIVLCCVAAGEVGNLFWLPIPPP